jgi:hypothetical protein
MENRTWEDIEGDGWITLRRVVGKVVVNRGSAETKYRVVSYGRLCHARCAAFGFRYDSNVAHTVGLKIYCHTPSWVEMANRNWQQPLTNEGTMNAFFV